MFDLATIVAGIGAGVTYSLTSFSKKKGQPFDFTKFGTTIVIGAASGVIMSVMDVPLEIGTEYLVSLGAVPVIENVLKAIKRKIWDRFFE